ncbi:MAG: hypothetical protein WCX48_00475 [Bacteroidales bacterium]
MGNLAVTIKPVSVYQNKIWSYSKIVQSDMLGMQRDEPPFSFFGKNAAR